MQKQNYKYLRLIVFTGIFICRQIVIEKISMLNRTSQDNNYICQEKEIQCGVQNFYTENYKKDLNKESLGDRIVLNVWEFVQHG